MPYHYTTQLHEVTLRCLHIDRSPGVEPKGFMDIKTTYKVSQHTLTIILWWHFASSNSVCD